MVKAEWFERYTATELPETFDRIVQSWDTANESIELSDFSVCTTWGIKGKKLYLLSLLRKRLEYPDLKRAVREQRIGDELRRLTDLGEPPHKFSYSAKQRRDQIRRTLKLSGLSEHLLETC